MSSHIFTLSDGEEIPLVIESRRGLRNITLRPKTTPKKEIHISLPRWTSVSSAIKFAEQKRAWIEKIFARTPTKIKLHEGDKIMVLGQEFLISNQALGGRPEFLERRARDKIKEMFLANAKEIIKTVPPELRPTRIAVRDTTSRWGSCSSTGTISLSYRLAFAPPEVMRYVIMHELAHRKHMNHSPTFWNAVSELYGPGVKRAELWLKKNGAQLHRYF
ncbi:MAG: M48 family metallopeptidase [Alphaproteobacteria bacterium]|nr:M48 family metallopeptidase [Alphaproteobacteria bacterium]